MAIHFLKRTIFGCIFITVLLGCSDNTPTIITDSSYRPTYNNGGKNQDRSSSEKQESTFDWLGDSKESSSPLRVESNEDFLSVVSQSQITCEGICPRGVGLLLSYHQLEKQVTRCTAFLIQKNVLATNSHCVPADIKSGQNPDGRMIFLLPGHAYVSIVGVEKLIQASNIDEKNQFTQDYALLKIKSDQQKKDLLTVSREGVKDKVSYLIPHVNQINTSMGQYDFQVQTTSCRAIQNSPVFPFFNSDFSKIVTFENCPIIKGNSGSPILDGNGNVVAIISAYFILEKTPIGSLMKQVDLSHIPRIALATSFTCIKDFALKDPLNEVCDIELSQTEYYGYYKKLTLEALAKATDLDEKKNRENAELWKSLNSDIFGWKIHPKISDAKEREMELEFFSQIPLIASLDCIQPAEKWINKYSKYYLFYEEEASITVNSYLWGTMVVVDKDFNFSVQPKELLDGELKITFHPSAISKTGTAEVEVVKILDILGKKIEMTGKKLTLSVCQ